MTWIILLGVWCAGYLAGMLYANETRRLLRPLRCLFHACPGRISDTEHGLGWMCRDCGALKHWESWGRMKERQEP